MHIWTDEPQKELWRQLRYLTSPSNVHSILTGKTPSCRGLRFAATDAARDRAYEIAACVRQADEYQTAARAVGLATRPLLDFYSCQALAKAVVLAVLEDAELSGMDYHGLSTRPSTASSQQRRTELQSYRSDPTVWQIEREYAVTNEGVFPHLCRAFCEAQLAKGEVIHFQDVLRNTPDLAKLYERHYAEAGSCFYLYGKPGLDSAGHYQIHFSSRTDMAAVRAAFPEFADGFEDSMQHATAPGFRSRSPVDHAPPWVATQDGAIAGHYLVRGLPCGLRRSATILFAGLYILSNLVRYKPAFWSRELEGERSGAASVVEAFCNLARHKLPKDLLECFWVEAYTFGTPGYVS